MDAMAWGFTAWGTFFLFLGIFFLVKLIGYGRVVGPPLALFLGLFLVAIPLLLAAGFYSAGFP